MASGTFVGARQKVCALQDQSKPVSATAVMHRTVGARRHAATGNMKVCCKVRWRDAASLFGRQRLNSPAFLMRGVEARVRSYL